MDTGSEDVDKQRGRVAVYARVKIKKPLPHMLQSVCRTPGPLRQLALIKNHPNTAHEAQQRAQTQQRTADTHTRGTAVTLGSADDGLVGGKSTSVLFQLRVVRELPNQAKAEVGQSWDHRLLH